MQGKCPACCKKALAHDVVNRNYAGNTEKLLETWPWLPGAATETRKRQVLLGAGENQRPRWLHLPDMLISSRKQDIAHRKPQVWGEHSLDSW